MIRSRRRKLAFWAPGVALVCAAAVGPSATAAPRLESEWIRITKRSTFEEGAPQPTLRVSNKKRQLLWIRVSFDAPETGRSCDTTVRFEKSETRTFECPQDELVTGASYKFTVRVYTSEEMTRLVDKRVGSFTYDESDAGLDEVAELIFDAPTRDVLPDKAVVRVVSPSPIPRRYELPVFFGDEPVGYLGPRTFFRLEVEPGDHLVWGPDGTEGEWLHFKAGHAYVLTMVLSVGQYNAVTGHLILEHPGEFMATMLAYELEEIDPGEQDLSKLRDRASRKYAKVKERAGRPPSRELPREFGGVFFRRDLKPGALFSGFKLKGGQLIVSTDRVRLGDGTKLDVPIDAIRKVEFSGARVSDNHDWLTLHYEEDRTEKVAYLGTTKRYNQIFSALLDALDQHPARSGSAAGAGRVGGEAPAPDSLGAGRSAEDAVSAQAVHRYPEVPEELDGKGLFALPEERAARFHVEMVTSNDWLHVERGLKDRQRGARVEYDTAGRVIKFSGHRDRQGSIESEFVYADGKLVEERHFQLAQQGDGRTLYAKIVYDYSRPGTKERVAYDAEGEVRQRVRYVHDDAGRVVRMEALDPASGERLAVAQKAYDQFGNPVRELTPDGLVVFSYGSNVVTVSSYSGREPVDSRLHSTREYTFDTDGNLISYRRASGDGAYWDKFTYVLDERGLPTEKTWSRKELIVQDPYEVTKYLYACQD